MLASSLASFLRQRSSMPLRSAAAITARSPRLRARRMPHSSKASRTPATRNFSSSAAILSAPPHRARKRASPSASSSLPPGKTSAPEKESIAWWRTTMKTSRAELGSPGTEGRSSRTVVAGRGTGTFFCCSVMHRLSHSLSDTANGRVYPAERPFRREKETMSVTSNSPVPNSLGEGLKALHAKWGWIVALGIIFMIAGVIALGSVVMATVSAIYVIGIMMIMAGVTEIATAFSVKDWGRFALWMLLGLLYVAAGVICFFRPFEAAAIVTLMLGIALMIGGVVRGFLAWSVREAGKPWGWVAVSALITLLLGIIIIAKWPYSSAYTLGIFLGIDLIFIGSSWLGIGLALKKRAA
jgi:uncharacterized membrane protein HdeD (DUF308 family)